MSLYELSLLSLYGQIIPGNFTIDVINDILPEDISDEINNYLKANNAIEQFYISLNYQHFRFSDKFLTELSFENEIQLVNDALYYANNTNTAEYLIRNNADDVNLGLIGAIRRRDMTMIEFFLGIGADNLNHAMSEAISLNHDDIAYSLISKGANDYGWGLLSAVISNNLPMIKDLIKLGADDFDEAMIQSVISNNIKLVTFFIEKGANDWINGFIYAVGQGNRDLATYFIMKNNNIIKDHEVLKSAMGMAINNNNFNILDLLFVNKHNKPNLVVMGEALQYFVKNADFLTGSGIDISTLIPCAMNGIANRSSIKGLLMIYYFNNAGTDYSLYFDSFGKIPSTLQHEGSSRNTLQNIKIGHPGFVENYVDKVYFSNIISLNIYHYDQLSKDNKSIINNSDITKITDYEGQIISAILKNITSPY